VFPKTPTSGGFTHLVRHVILDISKVLRAGRGGAELGPCLLKLQPHQHLKFLSPIATHLQHPTSHRIATRPPARRRSFDLLPRHCDTLYPYHIRSRKPSASRRKRYVTSIKRSTHSNSSCPTPHLQVSPRNPHHHHIHLSPPNHRLQIRTSSPPTMQAAVLPPPHSAPLPASRPDK
jgi:hypothetical protein